MACRTRRPEAQVRVEERLSCDACCGVGAVGAVAVAVRVWVRVRGRSGGGGRGRRRRRAGPGRGWRAGAAAAGGGRVVRARSLPSRYRGFVGET